MSTTIKSTELNRMKRSFNTGIRFGIYLLLPLLLVSPYLSYCDYDHQVHALRNNEGYDQLGFQFNRMSSEPINLNADHLKVLPIFLIPSDLEHFKRGSDYQNQGNLAEAIAQYQQSIATVLTMPLHISTWDISMLNKATWLMLFKHTKMRLLYIKKKLRLLFQHMVIIISLIILPLTMLLHTSIWEMSISIKVICRKPLLHTNVQLRLAPIYLTQTPSRETLSTFKEI